MTKVIVFGSQQIAADFVEYLDSRSDVEIPLVVTSESEHDKLYGYESLARRARALGLQTRSPKRVPEVLDEVEAAGPDIVFSIYYRRIFPVRLLDIPRLGCINIHPGLLPRYRGPTPTAWAILNGENRFGITIHLMDADIDTGDILFQQEYDIDPDETGYQLHLRAMRLGAELLKRSFDMIVGQDVVPRKQTGDASYFGKLKTRYVIDWQTTSERIRNAVRVYAKPYNRVETQLQERRVLMNHVTILKDTGKYQLQGPGKIVDVLDDDSLVVSAADGFLVLDDYEIVPPLSAQERDVLLRVGNTLG